MKTNLCETCERETGLVELGDGGWLDELWTTGKASASLGSIIKTFKGRFRYPSEAYEFVSESLVAAQFAKQKHAQLRRPEHVSATQALEEFRRIALTRFGKQARAQLAGWGIHRTEDVGVIVFELVEEKFFGKAEEDKLEDFANGYDFGEAFPED